MVLNPNLFQHRESFEVFLVADLWLLGLLSRMLVEILGGLDLSAGRFGRESDLLVVSPLERLSEEPLTTPSWYVSAVSRWFTP